MRNRRKFHDFSPDVFMPSITIEHIAYVQIWLLDFSVFFCSFVANMDRKTFFENELLRCADVVSRGGVIAYPTDTVWGIGCDSSDSDAVEKVFDIKRRSDAKALISLVADEEMLEAVVGPLSAEVRELVRSDRPTTVIFEYPRGLAPEMLAADGSAAIRITRELFSQQLCRRLGRPLVSTSANVSGKPTPARFSDISGEILDAVDYVAGYGRDDAEPHAPSRIVKIAADGELVFIRK